MLPSDFICVLQHCELFCFSVTESGACDIFSCVSNAAHLNEMIMWWLLKHDLWNYDVIALTDEYVFSEGICFTYLSFLKHKSLRHQKRNVIGLGKVQRIQRAVECLLLTWKLAWKGGHEVPSLPFKISLWTCTFILDDFCLLNKRPTCTYQIAVKERKKGII